MSDMDTLAFLKTLLKVFGHILYYFSTGSFIISGGGIISATYGAIILVSFTFSIFSGLVSIPITYSISY